MFLSFALPVGREFNGIVVVIKGRTRASKRRAIAAAYGDIASVRAPYLTG